jgi:hypothetical protein
VATVESAQEIRIKAMLLADAAQAVAGKLYLLGGGFDRINVANIPAVHQFDLALLVEVPWTATNEPTQILVELVDADNNFAGYRADAVMEAGRPAGARRGAPFNIPLTVPVIATFPQPGRYAVRVVVNGNEQERCSIEVVGPSPSST